jgi:hypothetical protein
MRTLLMCLASIAFLLCHKSEAASAPVRDSVSHAILDSHVATKPLLKNLLFTPHKKVGLIKRVQLKLLQKSLTHFSRHAADGTKTKKNTLSTISLIFGILGLIALLIPAIGGIAIVAAPIALVTGIVALGKHYNNDKASRTKAIIGIVLGGVLIFFIMIALIVILSGGFLLFM